MSKERNSQDRALVSGSLPSIFSRNSPQSPPRKGSQAGPVPDELTVDNTGKEYDSKKINALNKNFLSPSSSSQIQARSKPQERSVTTPSKIQAGSSRSTPHGSPSSSGQHHQESIVTGRSRAPGMSLPGIQSIMGASTNSDTTRHDRLLPAIELNRDSKGGQRQQQATPSTPSGKIVSSTSRPKTDGSPANRVTPDTRHTPPSARPSIGSSSKLRTDGSPANRSTTDNLLKPPSSSKSPPSSMQSASGTRQLHTDGQKTNRENPQKSPSSSQSVGSPSNLQIENQSAKRLTPHTPFETPSSPSKRPTSPAPETEEEKPLIPRDFKAVKKCAFCSFQGQDGSKVKWSDIDTHRKIKHKGETGHKYGCPECTETFTDDFRARDHQWTVHTDEGIIAATCKICKNRYNLSVAYKDHIAYWKKHRPVCKMCYESKNSKLVNICCATYMKKHCSYEHPENEPSVNTRTWKNFIKLTRDAPPSEPPKQQTSSSARSIAPAERPTSRIEQPKSRTDQPASRIEQSTTRTEQPITRTKRSKKRETIVPDDFKVIKMCGLCDYTGPDTGKVEWKDIKEHHSIAHKEAGGKNIYGCAICRQQFNQHHRIRSHQWLHSDDGRKATVCHICDYPFEAIDSLNSHLKAWNKNGYICNECSRNGLTENICTAIVAVQHYRTDHRQTIKAQEWLQHVTATKK